jgi:hypothetical protein
MNPTVLQWDSLFLRYLIRVAHRSLAAAESAVKSVKVLATQRKRHRAVMDATRDSA